MKKKTAYKTNYKAKKSEKIELESKIQPELITSSFIEDDDVDVPMRARIKRNGRYGFVDQTGEEVIPPIYDNASDFSESEMGYYAKVRIDGKEGLININGDTLVPIIYEDISGFVSIYLKGYDDCFGEDYA